MADRNDKMPENVPGAYYVDSTCTGCGLCIQSAPDFFGERSDGLAFVKTQPQSDGDKELCEEALDSCPVEAIGNDG